MQLRESLSFQLFLPPARQGSVAHSWRRLTVRPFVSTSAYMPLRLIAAHRGFVSCRPAIPWRFSPRPSASLHLVVEVRCGGHSDRCRRILLFRSSQHSFTRDWQFFQFGPDFWVVCRRTLGRPACHWVYPLAIRSTSAVGQPSSWVRSGKCSGRPRTFRCSRAVFFTPHRRRPVVDGRCRDRLLRFADGYRRLGIVSIVPPPADPLNYLNRTF